MATEISNRVIVWIAILLILASGIAGFFIGRSNIKTISNVFTKYDTLPAIHDTLKLHEPNHVTTPQSPLWKYDTIYINNTPVIKIDTMAILADWIKRRTYNENLFSNDSIGKLNLSLIVQYNKLQSVEYNYTPIQKTVTNNIITEHKYRPFIMVGFNTANQTAAQIGMFSKHFGISYECNMDKINNKIITNHGIKLGYQW